MKSKAASTSKAAHIRRNLPKKTKLLTPISEEKPLLMAKPTLENGSGLAVLYVGMAITNLTVMDDCIRRMNGTSNTSMWEATSSLVKERERLVRQDAHYKAADEILGNLTKATGCVVIHKDSLGEFGEDFPWHNISYQNVVDSDKMKSDQTVTREN